MGKSSLPFPNLKTWQLKNDLIRKLQFKICDFRDWAANIYSTFIAQKFGQLIEHEKYFSSKNHAKIEIGRLVVELFLFFKEALYKVKAGGQHLCFYPIQDGGGGQKAPSTSFSPATSANVGISPENFLSFSFNPFATHL